MEQAKSQINKFYEEYKQGVKNSIKTATEAMYNQVISNCYNQGINNHTSSIHWSYDENTNTGRVWSDDMVIIFNEMGTGIVGSSNSHEYANQYGWKYDVNHHGEAGWTYPKGDGTYGWTKGLPSRHMFYDAFNQIKDKIGEYVEVEMRKL